MVQRGDRVLVTEGKLLTVIDLEGVCSVTERRVTEIGATKFCQLLDGGGSILLGETALELAAESGCPPRPKINA
jgi:hypothetical protein